MKYSIIFVLIFSTNSLFARAFDQALEKFNKASSLKFDIKKTDEKKILGTKSTSTGVLKVQKNKIFISLNGDKKSEIYFSGSTLTLVDYPDADLDAAGKRKVMIFKKTNTALVRNLLALFYNSDSFKKQFIAESESIAGGIETVEFKSKQTKISNLVVKTDVAENNIQEISFEDDAKNKTTIQFNNMKLNEKLAKASFSFKPLATDEVVTQ